MVALYETVAEPLPEAQRAAVAGADYVTFTSSSTVRFFFDAVGDGLGARTRLASIGPVTSAALRERGLRARRRGRAPRHRRARRGAGRRRRAGSRAALRWPTVHHLPVRLRPRRRLRRRLPRRDRHASARRRGSSTSPTASRATTSAAGALVLAESLPYVPAGRAPGGGRPRRRRRAPRGGAARWPTSGCWSGPTTACCGWRRRAGGGIVEAVDIARSPFRLEPVSATFHGRDIFAPVAAHLAAGAALARGGRPARPGRAGPARAAAGRGARAARSSPTCATSTASATCSSMPATRIWPAPA